jgi:hypothetical protein
MIKHAHDRLGKRLGAKTTTLEFIGILLPFLMIPEQLQNQHIVVKVDNGACYFGWINRSCPNDEMASILIRALHLIGAFLGSFIHIHHLPRMSNWEAQLVDRLSRSETTTSADRRLLRSFQGHKLPSPLRIWLENPREDWDLPISLLESIVNKMSSKK